jgi:hypothetical protein
MEKENLQNTYFIVIYIHQAIKKKLNKGDERGVSYSLILKNFVLKINSYVHTQMYIYT